MTIKELLSGQFKCTCGRPHHCDMKDVLIEKGAVQQLPRYLQGFRHVLLVSDGNTRRVCGETVLALIEQSGLACDEAYFDTTSPITPDEAALAHVQKCVHEGIDLIVGVGSGVINDLCKTAAVEFNLPYLAVITAPSMDGIATSVAVLARDGLKVTVPMKSPTWIICDLDVLCNAPIGMISSGIGDVLGKYSALSDWKLANLLYNEPFCPEICNTVDVETHAFVKIIQNCLNREPEAIAALAESLVNIGIMVAFVNSSRPGSGSEHLMAHYLEITGMVHNTPYYTHGIDVGFSSVVIEKLRKRLAHEDPAVFCENFDKSVWEKGIRRVCGHLAEEVLSLQESAALIAPGRLPMILAHWDEIKALLLETPDEVEMRRLLDLSGINMDTCMETYGKPKVRDAARYAGDLKTRYTLLTLLRDVGLLDRYAEEMTL